MSYVDAKLENGERPAESSFVFTILASFVIVACGAGALGFIFYGGSSSSSGSLGRDCFCALDPFNQTDPDFNTLSANCLPFTNITGVLTLARDTPFSIIKEAFLPLFTCADNSTTGVIAAAGFDCAFDCVSTVPSS